MKIVCLRDTYQSRKLYKRGTVLDFPGEEKGIPPHFERLGKRKKLEAAPVFKDPQTLKEINDLQQAKADKEKARRKAVEEKKKAGLVLSEAEQVLANEAVDAAAVESKKAQAEAKVKAEAEAKLRAEAEAKVKAEANADDILG